MIVVIVALSACVYSICAAIANASVFVMLMVMEFIVFTVMVLVVSVAC